MKKAKVALLAVALFAVVGGSLAFKAKTTVTLWQKTSATTCPAVQIQQSAFTNNLDYALSSQNATNVNPQGDASKCDKTIYLTAE